MKYLFNMLYKHPNVVKNKLDALNDGTKFVVLDDTHVHFAASFDEHDHEVVYDGSIYDPRYQEEFDGGGDEPGYDPYYYDNPVTDTQHIMINERTSGDGRNIRFYNLDPTQTYKAAIIEIPGFADSLWVYYNNEDNGFNGTNESNLNEGAVIEFTGCEYLDAVPYNLLDSEVKIILSKYNETGEYEVIDEQYALMSYKYVNGNFHYDAEILYTIEFNKDDYDFDDYNQVYTINMTANVVKTGDKSARIEIISDVVCDAYITCGIDPLILWEENGPHTNIVIEDEDGNQFGSYTNGGDKWIRGYSGTVRLHKGVNYVYVNNSNEDVTSFILSVGPALGTNLVNSGEIENTFEL